MSELLTKEQIAKILESIAQLLELKGENPFKIRAYQTAARAVEMYSGDLYATASAGELESIPGVGKSVAAKLTELLTTGSLEYFDTLRAEFPSGIFEFFGLYGLGAKKIRALYLNLGIRDVASLELACKDGRVAELPGFGAKTAEKICAAIARRKETTNQFRIGSVAGECKLLLEALRNHPEIIQISEAGSFRRRKEILHDLDIVISTNNVPVVADFFTKLPEVSDVIARGETKITVRLHTGITCDARFVTNHQFVFALHHFTGSKEHNIALRQRALDQKGWSISEYAFTPVGKSGGQIAERLPSEPVVTETDFYRALGLSFIPPELRENMGEIAAAEKNQIPLLVELENLRGTFHCHTIASDGHDTLKAMADAARDLGFQYLGIADHSKSSVQANGLTEKALLEQKAEIDLLNDSYAAKGIDFRIFSGVECDILRDGSMDFSNEVLSQLDYVVASIHSAFTLPQKEMTDRFLNAIQNPYVTMLGHLTGRLLLVREGYALDIPAILEACAKTKTIIELNSDPRRLDLDWRWWKRATEIGVECAINPDAHRIAAFQYLWFGINSARKGWLTPKDVVNCLPLSKIQERLQLKRFS